MTAVRLLIWLVVALLTSFSCQAAIHRVGTFAEYTTLQDALAAAVLAGGGQEIRVEVGFHFTKVDQIIVGGQSIVITGGWDSTFATRSLDPTLTRMEGLPGLPVLRLAMTGGSLFMDGLTIAFGEATSALSAGGVNANLSGDAILTLTRCVISENHSSFGTAGVRIRAVGTSRFQLNSCAVNDNTADGAGDNTGIGMRLVLSEFARAYLTNGDFTNNHDGALSTATFGAGLGGDASDSSAIQLTRVRVRNHALQAPLVTGGGIVIATHGNAFFGADQVQVRDNTISATALANPFGDKSLWSISAEVSSQIQVFNSLIADSNGGGLFVNANNQRPIGTSFVGLTVSRNALYGIALEGSVGGVANSYIYDSIVHENAGGALGLQAASGTQLLSNLGDDVAGSGADPQFVAASSGDYHLAAGSPAIDAGVAGPGGGISVLDLDSNPRIQGAQVDIGAYEFRSDALFQNGFE